MHFVFIAVYLENFPFEEIILAMCSTQDIDICLEVHEIMYFLFRKTKTRAYSTIFFNKSNDSPRLFIDCFKIRGICAIQKYYQSHPFITKKILKGTGFNNLIVSVEKYLEDIRTIYLQYKEVSIRNTDIFEQVPFFANMIGDEPRYINSITIQDVKDILIFFLFDSESSYFLIFNSILKFKYVESDVLQYLLNQNKILIRAAISLSINKSQNYNLARAFLNNYLDMLNQQGITLEDSNMISQSGIRDLNKEQFKLIIKQKKKIETENMILLSENQNFRNTVLHLRDQVKLTQKELETNKLLITKLEEIEKEKEDFRLSLDAEKRKNDELKKIIERLEHNFLNKDEKVSEKQQLPLYLSENHNKQQIFEQSEVDLLKEKLENFNPLEIDEENCKNFIVNISTDWDNLKQKRKTLCGNLDNLGSKQYSKQTHFLQEMIQNVNDSMFDNKTPKIFIEINTKKYVIIASTEIGVITFKLIFSFDFYFLFFYFILLKNISVYIKRCLFNLQHLKFIQKKHCKYRDEHHLWTKGNRIQVCFFSLQYSFHQ